jgi:hypothetical protein
LLHIGFALAASALLPIAGAAAAPADKMIKAEKPKLIAPAGKTLMPRNTAPLTRAKLPGDGSVRPGDGSVKPGDGSVKPKSDSMGDISQQQQLRLQTVMDRKTKAEQAASNASKKISDTNSKIIGNMK